MTYLNLRVWDFKQKLKTLYDENWKYVTFRNNIIIRFIEFKKNDEYILKITILRNKNDYN